MANTDRTSNQGGQGQGNKPGQGGGQQGQGGGDKSTTRPTPSGVPNEGRGTENQHRRQDQGARTGKGDYEYKGGRQGTGGIPNPDDQDDGDSAGSFRGTAGLDTGEDDDDDLAQGLSEEQRRQGDPNNQNPKSDASPNQRRVVPSNEEKR
jgi:hypothetical protein